jgi:hypothetical protein
VPAGSSQPVPAGAIHIQPNPASTSTTVRYQIDRRTPITVTIYDALGHIVSQPVADAIQETGEHQIVVATDGLAAGVYLCSVNAGGVERAVRFVVVR